MESRDNIRQLFFRHLAQTSPAPIGIQVERAEGSWLYGPGDKKYLDLISGISVSNIGHRAPEVLDAVRKQLDRYLHTMVYGELVLSPQVELAELLTQTLNNGIDNFFFVNSGSEAVEGALKLAKKYTGRTEIVSFHKSYHGSTHGALSVTGSDQLKEGYGPLLRGINFIQFNKLEDLSYINERTACVIIEPIQAEAGVVLPEAGFFQALRKRCVETGALLILDEIQTAYGRTGTLFAFQWLGINPDIILLAKGIGGGMPIGVFGARREVMSALSHDPILGHISTFGGHPVSCAAAIATLKKITDENLCAGVEEREELIRKKLVHPAIKNLRGKGLLFAVEFSDELTASKILDHCIQLGVLTDFFLHNASCLRVAPPLVISLTELEWGLDKMLESIEMVSPITK